MSVPVRAAATLILLDGPEEAPRALLLLRAAQSPFMANVWVFPGGRVDDADRALAAAPGLSTARAAALVRRAAGLRDASEARAHLVCAVRETFEEAGVLLGAAAAGAALAPARARLLAGETTWGAVVAELEPVIAWEELIYCDHWVTPPIERRRYDTRFFVARVGEGAAEASHDALETTDAVWLSAHDALGRHAAGELSLAPPTFWLLSRFAALGSIDAILGWAAARDVPEIAPAVVARDGGVALVLPGDRDHPDTPGGAQNRIVWTAQGWSLLD